MDRGSGEAKVGENEYGFVPAHLRHHFAVDAVFGGDAQEQDEIRRARRARSAHLVASALDPATAATKATTTPGSGSTLYSQSVEHAITARMTFDRTLARLEAYFKDHATKLRQLEDAQAVVVPEWLYDSNVKLPTLLQVQRHVVQAVESCLSESDVYLAMFEPLPSPPAASPTPLLRFVVCSSKSSMAHHVLLREPDGSATTSHEPHSNQQEHDSDNVPKQQLGSVSFQVMENRRELVIEDIEALPRSQIHRFTPETVTGPFACFPLLTASRATAFGVLSLDSCRKALRLRPESMTTADLSDFLVRKGLKDAATELRKHKVTGLQFLLITERDLNHKPMFASLKIATRKRILEVVHALKRGAMVHLARPARYFFDDPDAFKFLHNVALSSGNFFEGFRGVHWHRVIANATKDAGCSVYDVYDVLLRGIAQSVDSVERVVVWRVSRQTKKVEIDVVASTQVPDDRLMPFLQWSERLIKRLVLYKVGSESSGELISGTIMRILIANQEATSHDTRAECERAQYQVSWLDRTVERLSWSQLRQVLPIRAMNVKHFQFTHLLEQLTQAQEVPVKHSHSPNVIRLTTLNGLALVIQNPQSPPDTQQYVLEVDFTPTNDEPPRSVVTFLQRAAGITQRSLACVRGREIRRLSRQLSSVRVSQEFHSMGLTPSPDALRALSEVVSRVFAEISANLPGVELQVAELQPDGAQLLYTFAANGSSLLNKVLTRGQGVSFRCLDSKEPLVVQRHSELRSRLRRLGRALQDSDDESDTEFPYLFLPLLHEDCAVGVLSVNRFVDVPKGRRDEEQPEAGVVLYLQSVIKSLGSAIYLKRRSFALYQLQTLANEPLRSPHQLLLNACRAVKDTVVGAWKVRIVEVDCARGKTSAIYELSEAERALQDSLEYQFMIPVRLRVKEMLRDTLKAHFSLTDAQIEDIYASITSHDQEDAEDIAKWQQIDAESSRTTTSVPESEKRHLQAKRVISKYLNLMLQGDDDQPEDLAQVKRHCRVDESRLSNEKYISHALSVFLGGGKASHAAEIPSLALRSSRVFLTSANLPQFHAACEQNYIARVSAILSKLTEDLYQRVERSRARVRAIEIFKVSCEQAIAELRAKLNNPGLPEKPIDTHSHNLTPEEELTIESVLSLQQRAIALLEGVFFKTNVYIGLLESSLRLIRYTSASAGSVMKGKQLKRGHGVSFHALEAQVPVVITQRDAEAADDDTDNSTSSLVRQLRYFTKEPKKLKWPFIVVPIGAFGILSLDNLERYERLACEPQPELGIVDFLRQVATQIARVIEIARKTSLAARQELRVQALTRIMRACDDVKSTRAPLYLQHVVVQEITRALNGVDAYIGIAQPLCESIRFTCASSRSNMEGQVVNTVESASFRVFTTQRPLVIPQLQSYWHYQESDEHAAVANNGRLRAFGSQSSQLSGPFVCVPIPFVGVLSVDTFPGAASGVFTHQFPEKGVVEFLARVANHLGENMRTQSAIAASKKVLELFEGNKSTLHVMFQELLRLLASNLVAVEEMQVLRWALDATDPESQLIMGLKRSKLDEHAAGGINALKPEILQEVKQRQNSDIDKDVSCFALPGTPEVIVALLEPTRDVKNDEGAYHLTAIVLRRVHGATWAYDVEFLNSIVPLVNDVLAQVNTRIQGIVTRRRALTEMDRIAHRLTDELGPQDAVEKLHGTVNNVLELIAHGLSLGGCDMYLGERMIGGETLRFPNASSTSLMENVTLCLSDEANQSLVSVQCLQHKQSSVVLLSDGSSKNDKTLKSLTTKKAQRVYMVISMGDDRILCADSLGPETLHPKTRKLETDVLQFFTKSAQKLNELILSVHYRRSYDDLVKLKKSDSHPNFRLFFATLLQIVRRDLVVVHSQQIVTLASDFTGRFHTEAWHLASTRRPLATGSTSSGDHFCYLNQCEEHLIAQDIHHEAHVALPMTNLPRTLDESRSSLEPVEGLEKRGVFACSCLATMLDAHLAAPRVALIVYTHDPKTSSKTQTKVPPPPSFTANQRQFFFALAAVAADVFTHVYRSCALHSMAHELFFVLREQLNAKEGFVAQVQDNRSTKTSDDGDNAADSSKRVVVVLYSSQEAKHPRNSVLHDAMATKILQFHSSCAAFAIFVRKKPEPSLLIQSPSVGASRAAIAQQSSSVDPKPQTKASTSFFKRPDIFKSRKAKQQEKQEQQAAQQAAQSQQQQQQQISQSLPDNQSSSQYQPRFKFHVLLRGIELENGQVEVFSFDVEHWSMDGVKILERIASQARVNAQSLVDNFQKQPPRGDEELIGHVLGSEAQTNAYHVSHGGGFYLFSQLTQAKRAFQSASLGLETDIRGFLTGVQPTARDPALLMTGRLGAQAHDHSHQAPAKSIFSEDNNGDDEPTAQAALVLIEAAILLAGATRKDALAKMDKHAMLKEFLRGSISKKLGDMNPRERKQWGPILRLKTFLQSVDRVGVLQRLQMMAVPSSSASASMANTVGQVHHAHTGHSGYEPTALSALQALWTLLATLIAVVRFLKHLEGDAAREKRQVDRRVTIIQCFYRCARAKAQLKQLKREFLVARAIQCAFRQHLARRRALFMKWTRSAIKIQRAYRLKLMRRKGSRPKRLSDELLAISKRFGGLAPTSPAVAVEDSQDDAGWRVEMDAFNDFKAYVASRAGKEQLKHEEKLMTNRMHEVLKGREKLPPEERMLEDMNDLFELMDTNGSGELSREDTREMMKRLHVPLAQDEADDVIDMMDSDHSGEISLVEFTNWFVHELPLLKKRSKDCGVVSKKDWQWMIENSARSALRKRWRAHRVGRETGGGGAGAKAKATVHHQEANAEDEDGNLDSGDSSVAQAENIGIETA